MANAGRMLPTMSRASSASGPASFLDDELGHSLMGRRGSQGASAAVAVRRWYRSAVGRQRVGRVALAGSPPQRTRVARLAPPTLRLMSRIGPRSSRPPLQLAAVLMVGSASMVLWGCNAPPPDVDAPEVGVQPTEITIRGQDYAFELTEPVPAGMVHFSFENVGEVPHEVIIVQLNEGVTAEQVGQALQGATDPETLMAGIAGILIADPGEVAMGRLAVELESGRTYALLCNFTDTDDAPPHIALGMIRIFQAS